MSREQIEAYIAQGRDFIRTWERDCPDFVSDQDQKLPQPPLANASRPGAPKVKLPMGFEELPMSLTDVREVMMRRCSRRVYTAQNITLLQLSFLLWATQGVKSIRGNSYATLRTVACGGARHEFECYFEARAVEGLQEGIWHYLPLEHAIEYFGPTPGGDEAVNASVVGQAWVLKSSVIFWYSIVPYRAEWRYGINAHRVALIDAGHITQNLYLAAEALGLGTCAIAAVDPDVSDAIVGLDGDEEFIFYAASLGTVREEDAHAECDFYAFVREQGL